MTAPNTPPVPEPADTGAPDTATTPEGQAPDQRDAEVAALKSEAAKWRKALREREQELEQLRLSTASDNERAIAAAKSEGENAYRNRWRKAVVDNAALGALGERGVVATELALRALDLDDIDVDADGKFDRLAIAAKVEELLTRYPQLSPPGAAPSLPNLSGDTQHKVTSPVKQQGTTDKDIEQLLRYGLGAS